MNLAQRRMIICYIFGLLIIRLNFQKREKSDKFSEKKRKSDKSQHYVQIVGSLKNQNKKNNEKATN